MVLSLSPVLDRLVESAEGHTMITRQGGHAEHQGMPDEDSRIEMRARHRVIGWTGSDFEVRPYANRGEVSPYVNLERLDGTDMFASEGAEVWRFGVTEEMLARDYFGRRGGECYRGEVRFDERSGDVGVACIDVERGEKLRVFSDDQVRNAAEAYRDNPEAFQASIDDLAARGFSQFSVSNPACDEPARFGLVNQAVSHWVLQPGHDDYGARWQGLDERPEDY